MHVRRRSGCPGISCSALHGVLIMRIITDLLLLTSAVLDSTLAICTMPPQGSKEWHKRRLTAAASAAFKRFHERPPPRSMWNRMSCIAASPRAAAEMRKVFKETTAVVVEMTETLREASEQLYSQVLQPLQEMSRELQPQQRPRSRHHASRPSSAAALTDKKLVIPMASEHLLLDATVTPSTAASPSRLPGYSAYKTPKAPSPPPVETPYAEITLPPIRSSQFPPEVLFVRLGSAIACVPFWYRAWI